MRQGLIGPLRPASGSSPKERPAADSRSEGQLSLVGIAQTSAWFVYALLGADHDSSPYTQTGERIARIAAGGIRLVVDELRADVTKTRKTGPAAACASTTATTGTPRPRFSGSGSSSTAPRRPGSSTAGR